MATIKQNNASLFRLEQWLGLNESPDGDTGLKLGEAAVMRNFRITRENHLQLRPGSAPLCTLSENCPVRGLWSGYVNGESHLLAACGGQLWDIDTALGQAQSVGELDDEPVCFFGFSRRVYILTGREYYCWDGTSPVYQVDGYVPIVATAVPPTGGGTALERVNLLTGKKRARFSPDGIAKVFHLPEGDIDEVLYVSGTGISWSADPAAGTVTFAGAPPQGVNSLTVTWRKGVGQRTRVTGMRFAESYNGDTDARVFLYGDGTNEALYSDLDEYGRPSAEYFPDLNVMAVDSANTPVTAMIRHYDRLLVFKSDSAYAVEHGSLKLEGGAVTAAFTVIPVNRAIGCAAMGQARLIRNDPRTLFGRSVYTWSLTSGAARDERSARRISDRVESTLGALALEKCVCFDDERRQEYYIFCGKTAVVHNYGNDTWYVYTGLDVRCMEQVEGERYFGTGDGRVMHLSRAYRNDDLTPIDAWWESGALDFRRDWRRKGSASLWVSIKPESQARVTVSAQSNRQSEHPRRTVYAGLSTLGNANFAHWSFSTNRKPQVQRVKLKVKKFTFYKLIFSSCSASAAATVLSAQVQVRYGGNVW